MIQVVLYQPEIPPNTGNIIRLCANTGASLHLVSPLARVRVHDSLEACLAALNPTATYAFSSRASTCFTDAEFESGCALLFGPETRGLPDAVLASVPVERRLTLPMLPGNRSLNLSNAVAVAVYEAWRRQGFAGAVTGPRRIPT